MRPSSVVTAAVIALLGANGCKQAEKTPEERGQGVFQRACAGCHGANARGSRQPGFTVNPRDLTDPELQARLTDALLRDTIHYGKGQMPPFGAALPDEDVTNVIRFLRSLRRNPPPHP